jgi:hypothetical protein
MKLCVLKEIHKVSSKQHFVYSVSSLYLNTLWHLVPSTGPNVFWHT